MVRIYGQYYMPNYKPELVKMAQAIYPNDKSIKYMKLKALQAMLHKHRRKHFNI